MENERALRNHLLELLGSSHAHLDFEKATTDSPTELRGAKPSGYDTVHLIAHCRGTGVPHSRQVAAPRWTGFLQRGQIRSPASNFTAEAGGDMGGTKPISVSASAPGSDRLDTTGCGNWQLRVDPPCLRDVNPILRVVPGLWRQALLFVLRCRSVPRCFAGTAIALACAVVGTGTTRPQSGHLPATGRSMADTFSRRPHGQRNRKNPSPVSPPGNGAPDRRSRIFAPHLGQSIRSGPPGCTFSFSPQRQVTRGMRRAWRLMVYNAKNWMF